MNLMQLKYSGIVVPLITPLTRNLDLDWESTFRIVEYVIEGGVNGIFLLGTTGEGPNLDPEVKRQVVETGVKAASGRLPLFVNITANSLKDVLGLAHMAAEAGANYLVLAPPYYYQMNQGELRRFFELIAENSTLPLVLYNAPQYTKNKIGTNTVFQLSKHEKIVGIKDSSGSAKYIKSLLDLPYLKQFPLLIGPEHLLVESMLMGCSGGVNGGANLFPSLYSDILLALERKEMNELKKLQTLLSKIDRDLYQVADSSLGIVIGLKYLLSLKGLCHDWMALPVYEDLSEVQKWTMKNLLKEMESLNY